MLKKIFYVIKKIIVAVLLIYGYNKLALPLNIVIPLNVITIFLVYIGGIPSILMLILFSLVCIWIWGDLDAWLLYGQAKGSIWNIA